MLLGAIWNPGAAVANCSCDHFKPVLYILFMIYIYMFKNVYKYTCFKSSFSIQTFSGNGPPTLSWVSSS